MCCSAHRCVLSVFRPLGARSCSEADCEGGPFRTPEGTKSDTTALLSSTSVRCDSVSTAIGARSRPTASDFSCSPTCVYTFIVKSIVLCRASDWAIFGCTSARAKFEMKVCRFEWKSANRPSSFWYFKKSDSSRRCRSSAESVSTIHILRRLRDHTASFWTCDGVFHWPS